MAGFVDYLRMAMGWWSNAGGEAVQPIPDIGWTATSRYAHWEAERTHADWVSPRRYMHWGATR